ncbi:hypothetical protein [Nostoc sp. UHCC 0252]|uniref:hypothetical protein n=1 Tax=Nostoc sp. UHCC 0252 TaxID=3110241 RepID=UPI002B1F119D|nr:hypothetical protein [Nostoc sp. UHCC 0252]MEA5605796.1 hypothetical protein [Nostoc sp. UHCC 0252]
MEHTNSLLKYVLFAIDLILIWDLVRDKKIQIYEQTQNKLKFIIQPKLLRFIGFFIGQIGIISLYALFMFIPVTQLDCNRILPNIDTSNIEQKSSKIICQLIEFDFFGHQKSQKQISGLTGSRLEKQTKTDTEGKILYTYRVQLLTNAESIPFTRTTYSDYFSEEAEFIILKIENFLVQPLEKSLVVKQDDTLVGYAVIGITIFCLLLGLLIIASGSFIDFNFDKESNSLSINRYKWFGILGKSVFLYSLNEIVDIKVESFSSGEDSTDNRVTLILESGESVFLIGSYDSGGYSSGFQEKQEIVKIIKNFLASN